KTAAELVLSFLPPASASERASGAQPFVRLVRERADLAVDVCRVRVASVEDRPDLRRPANPLCHQDHLWQTQREAVRQELVEQRGRFFGRTELALHEGVGLERIGDDVWVARAPGGVESP